MQDIIRLYKMGYGDSQLTFFDGILANREEPPIIKVQ
jgi:hypothetical protein